MAQLPSLRSAALCCFGFFASLASASAQIAPPPCQQEWLPTFGPVPGADSGVGAMAVFDDGSGPALYVGGSFRNVCGVAANLIAKWNGTTWSALGSGLDGSPQILGPAVYAMEVYDDGSGPALYVGGRFATAGGLLANGIARWNGASWSVLGTGMWGGGTVSALTVHDDGSGPALYAGGQFTNAGPTPANNIARWNGSSWSALGSGTNGPLSALKVHDDGSGPALYAGGGFTTAGLAPANNIARWNGSSWSALGSGVSGGIGSSPVMDLALYDDGGGTALYACGSLTSAGGLPADGIAKWDGSVWSPLGSGLSGSPVRNVAALCSYDDGSGPVLVVGGDFSSAGGSPASDIAQWNGAGWSPMAGGTNAPVATLCVYDAGGGPVLRVGGVFRTAGGVEASRITSWNGSVWSGFASGVNDFVYGLSVFDDGTGPALMAAGSFTNTEGIAANRIARWDGSAWSALGGGLEFGHGTSLARYDDGTGPALYVGGTFQSAGGTPAASIAKWDGQTWSPLGGGLHLSFQPHIADVGAMLVHDDGSGPALYVSGSFTNAGGIPVQGIAKWNGTSWSALPPGGAGGAALAVFDDGGGPALFVGSGGGVYKWNGSVWTLLPVTGASPAETVVYALTTFDDGSGLALYAGGMFTGAGGVAASNIAKWSGSSWSALGSGLNAWVNVLTVHDDGAGTALYAGGVFTLAGGVSVGNIAKWDGTSWSSLGAGVGPASVQALATFDDGGGPALFAGGSFGVSPAGDGYLAKWGNPSGCGAPGVSVCEPGVGGVSACPCANPPTGSGRGCDNSSFTGGALLSATGIARVGFDSVVFTSSGEMASATSILMQGDTLSAAGVVYGQGVRCVSGNLKRMYLKTAVAGSISAPAQSDPHVHARSAALGDPIAPGSHRYYGVYYRDPIVLGGCPAASGFNITQQLDLLWAP